MIIFKCTKCGKLQRSSCLCKEPCKYCGGELEVEVLMEYKRFTLSDEFRNWLWDKHSRELFTLNWNEFVKFTEEFFKIKT